MIKTFEAYSFPDSVVDLSKYISTFVNKKIRWWISRNKIANYTEDFVFDREEMGIEFNPDFPFERIKVKLKLTKGSKDWDIWGAAAMVKRKNWIDTELEYTNYNHGKIIPSIKFDISCNEYNIEIEEIEETIIALTRHEVLHIYQYYKKHKNKAKHYTHNAAAVAVLSVDDEYESEKFQQYMRMLYIHLTKEETEANLAEFTAGIKTWKIENRMKLKKEIESTPKDEYLNKISDEISEDEKKAILRTFLDTYLETSKDYGLKPKKFIINLANKGFDHFMSSTYDIIRNGMVSWSKKINKINYKNLNDKK